MTIDIQLELVREVARQYPRLNDLTRFPDSLLEQSPCKVVDEIRAMAIAYVVNEVLARTLSEDPANDNLKQKLSIPGTIISPYVGIPALEYDPMDLVGGSV